MKFMLHQLNLTKKCRLEVFKHKGFDECDWRARLGKQLTLRSLVCHPFGVENRQEAAQAPCISG